MFTDCDEWNILLKFNLKDTSDGHSQTLLVPN